MSTNSHHPYSPQSGLIVRIAGTRHKAALLRVLLFGIVLLAAGLSVQLAVASALAPAPTSVLTPIQYGGAAASGTTAGHGATLNTPTATPPPVYCGPTISFSSPVSYTVGTMPFSIAAGDLNSDSHIDLVTTNNRTGNVTVLLGDGVGHFTLHGNFSVGSSPSWGALGDFNNDGHLDIATAQENDGQVAIDLGSGDGSFGAPTFYHVDNSPVAVTVDDLNGDGRQDLAVAGLSNQGYLAVLLGNGDGTFQPAVSYPANANPYNLAAGDLNGDGHPDVVTANANQGNVSVLFNNGNGTFQAPVTYATSDQSRSVHIADINRDGAPDIVTANGSSSLPSVSVLLADGGGVFQPAHNYPVGSVPQNVAVGDFNGDGSPDLVVADYISGMASVLPGNGDGTFGAEVDFPAWYASRGVVVSDFNGDGKQDFAVVNEASNVVTVSLNSCAVVATPTLTPITHTTTPTRTRTPTGTATATATATATPTCGASWSQVTSPNPTAVVVSLNSVSAAAPDDIWAVGTYLSGGQGNQALIEHWDGTAWSIVPNPVSGVLQGVSAISSNDVWAVGVGGSAGNTMLIEHYVNGTWSVVPGPDPGAGTNSLASVAAVSPADVWAVGSYTLGTGPSLPLVIRWDGTSWTQVTAPQLSQSQLYGVYAASAGEIWAVGEYRAAGTGNPYRALTIRWDGTAWGVVDNPAGDESHLYGVGGSDQNNVWAVGTANFGDVTLAMHWDGTQWSVTSSPNVATLSNHFSGVVSTGPNDAWAVGAGTEGGSNIRAEIAHWNGSGWVLVSHPNPGAGNRLSGITAVSAGELWAVGSVGCQGCASTSLVERYHDPCATSTMTPTPTATGPTATRTATATSTAGATASPTATSAVTGVPSTTGTPAGTSPTTTPTLSPTPTCGVAWQDVNAPNPSGDTVLNGVADISSSEAWAVGVAGSGTPVVERWTGNAWSASTISGVSGTLTGVSALSSSDIWAVGYDTGTTVSRTLTLHWDGVAWTRIPSPNAASGDSLLNGVAAVSHNDVWAVGSQGSPASWQVLTLHWDGTQWSIVPGPGLSGSNTLLGVAAISGSDVWAVGQGTLGVALTLHWDGTTWSAVTNPSGEADFDTLTSVHGLSSNDVWAVGYSFDGLIHSYLTLAYHWDGAQWHDKHAPNPSNWSVDNRLQGVVALAPNDVWAVGQQGDHFFVGISSMLTHWDGTQWSIEADPHPASAGKHLWAISAAGSTEVWAVGHADAAPGGAGPYSPITLHYSPLPCTCTINFSDVQPTDYFYVPVQYLYCHGAISGYADGTFRPYNNTTRGQLSKIVVLAEGWAINTQGGPHFSDVPTDNPFYSYIETAYNRGVISGYADGTFRWGNNVTRGQLSKIVVLAQNWAVTPPSQPTFQDVPADNPFYGYIETAYSHGTISGYSCGTDCLEFRPGNNATRGQISKIVYNAVTQP